MPQGLGHHPGTGHGGGPCPGTITDISQRAAPCSASVNPAADSAFAALGIIKQQMPHLVRGCEAQAMLVTQHERWKNLLSTLLNALSHSDNFLKILQ